MTALVTDKLPVLAAAPNGISKLRELVFALAAQGRLVDDGEIATAPSIDLCEVAEFVMGQAPPGTACNFDGHGAAFVKTGEFGPLFPVVREWTTKPLKFARDGDVLICVVGATVGKLNLGIDCAIGRSVAAIRPKPVLSTRYLYFTLMPFTLKLRAKSRGSAQGVIGKSELAQVRLRLPSLASQHRIVAKVDELMALCDRLEAEQADAEAAHATLVQALLASLTQARDAADFHASWQQLSEHFHTLFTTETSIDALKSAVLRLAVMGRLAPQRPAETVDGLDTLSTVVAWRQQAVLRKEIREPRKPMEAIEDDEHPFVRPEGWKWIRLGTLIYIQSGDGLTAANMQPGDVPVFGGNGVNGHHDSCNVLSPTLVIGRVGYYCGSVHITPEKAWVTDNAFITKFCNEATDIRFLYWLLKCTNLKENDSATAQPVISGAKIYPIVVGLPPLAEQRRIVSKIDECITFCDQLKLRLIQASQQHEHLASVLVEQATV